MAEYSEVLGDKDEIIVANKIDLDSEGSAVEKLKEELGKDILAISAVTGNGIKELNEFLWSKIEEKNAAEQSK